MSLRGRILWPLDARRTAFLGDGVVGPDLPAPRPAGRDDPPPEDGLILPGFADWHFHWVQRGIAGVADATGRPLLEWLRETAWPAERAFSDEEACRTGAADAVRDLAAAGTMEGVAFASPHAASADAFLAAAPGGYACGPAVMTAGEPEDFLRPIGAWLADLGRLHEVHGRRVAVAPRFALSLEEGDLAALAAFAAERRLFVTTHLSENEEEVEEVRRRFPGARDYVDVYARNGLLGPDTLLAHGIHVSDDELSRIAKAGAVLVHCPSSNRALRSGRMPLERLRKAGVRWVLGSDVGAGPSLCMLDVAAEAVDAQEGRLSNEEAFHRAAISLAGPSPGGDPRGGLAPVHRPGALVAAPPEGVPADETDPRVWLDALLAERRERRPFEVRRAVPWGLSSAG